MTFQFLRIEVIKLSYEEKLLIEFNSDVLKNFPHLLSLEHVSSGTPWCHGTMEIMLPRSLIRYLFYS